MSTFSLELFDLISTADAEGCLELIEDGTSIDSINQKDYGEWPLPRPGDSALIAAARRRLDDVCMELLRHGADTSVKNSYGDTALVLAESNSMDTVCAALRRATPPSKPAPTPPMPPLPAHSPKPLKVL